MKINKILFGTIVLILITFGITACSPTIQEDKRLIKDFLDKYYSQLSYTEDEKEIIIKELENSSTKLSILKETEEENLLDNTDVKDTFVKNFIEILSPELIKSMIKNREIPNLNMMEYSYDKVEITNIRFRNKSDHINAKFKVKCYKNDILEQDKNLEYNFVVSEIDNQNYIDKVDKITGFIE